MSKRFAVKRDALGQLFERHGISDYRWIDPAEIEVAHWVRMKCMYGCPNYGKGGCCPPNVPTVEECEKFLHEYREAVVFHFEKRVKDPKMRHQWTSKINKKLLAVEREVFLLGYWKVFLLYIDSCNICRECAGSRIACHNKMSARPTPEAFCVDVYTTVRKLGYPIDVLRNYSEPMNRYAFLMIE